ncbi:hypothetical protein Gotur_016369 [Gossypium turneri]
MKTNNIWQKPLTNVIKNLIIIKSKPELMDRRRILAFPNGNIQEDRDEESVKLLKKIADMEIEEFPLHIIEKIKNTWETWNSPPRLSLDSLYLDEIEEMNLNNMQEDMMEATINNN